MRGKEEFERLIKIAQLYYEHHLSQEEIAQRIGISRSQISRLLKKAVDSGLIEIQVKILNPMADVLALSEKIQSQYGLREAIIVPIKNTSIQSVKRALGEAAARVLSREIKKSTSLGVSWGTTLRETPAFLRPIDTFKVKVIPLVGGFGQTAVDVHANEIARRIAENLNGEWYPIYAPAFFKNPVLRSEMEKDPEIHRVLNLAREVEIALVGIGAVNTDSILVSASYLSTEEMEELKSKKAVGDIVGRFFDKNGKTLNIPEIDQRILGLTLDDLTKIPTVIAVAEGKNKLAAIKGALRTGIIDLLITDDETAQSILSGTLPES
ncbi:MAG: sugar-binding transcriptional regulator [Atribacterota bacterium]|nr:sugar-binding transcriptional regulator [Candidatus Atribacteria bacterium]